MYYRWGSPVAYTETTVKFSYKDYRTEGQKKEMVLAGEEFLRRFTLHIVPPRFRRMRHYGILSNSRKKAALAAIRRDLQPEAPPQPPRKDQKELKAEAVKRLFGERDPMQCPCCQAISMQRIGTVPPQRPPPQGQMPRWKILQA
jgi:Putative transposase